MTLHYNPAKKSPADVVDLSMNEVQFQASPQTNNSEFYHTLRQRGVCHMPLLEDMGVSMPFAIGSKKKPPVATLKAMFNSSRGRRTWKDNKAWAAQMRARVDAW